MIHTEVFFPEFLFIPFTVKIELHIGHKDFCSTINEKRSGTPSLDVPPYHFIIRCPYSSDLEKYSKMSKIVAL